MFDQMAVRCTLGEEKFLFLHREGAHAEGSVEELLLKVFVDYDDDVHPKFPWLGFVWSPRLGEHVFRGHFNNAQVHNFMEYTKVDNSES